MVSNDLIRASWHCFPTARNSLKAAPLTVCERFSNKSLAQKRDAVGTARGHTPARMTDQPPDRLAGKREKSSKQIFGEWLTLKTTANDG